MRQQLTIGDGFRFGCGFLLAAIMYSAVMMLLLAIFMTVLAAGTMQALINTLPAP